MSRLEFWEWTSMLLDQVKMSLQAQHGPAFHLYHRSSIPRSERSGLLQHAVSWALLAHRIRAQGRRIGPSVAMVLQNCWVGLGLERLPACLVVSTRQRQLAAPLCLDFGSGLHRSGVSVGVARLMLSSHTYPGILQRIWCLSVRLDLLVVATSQTHNL